MEVAGVTGATILDSFARGTYNASGPEHSARARDMPPQFPPGWNDHRIRKVLDHYENQTEAEAIAEDEEDLRCLCTARADGAGGAKDDVAAVPTFHLNLSPDAFHLWALHFYDCKQQFTRFTGYSPVPYFLLCRAIELELKSRHLVDKRQREVKQDFGHDLVKAYNALPAEQQILGQQEISALRDANEVYRDKGFEYLSPADPLGGFRRHYRKGGSTPYPDLGLLDSIARKLTSRDDDSAHEAGA